MAPQRADGLSALSRFALCAALLGACGGPLPDSSERPVDAATPGDAAALDDVVRAPEDRVSLTAPGRPVAPTEDGPRAASCETAPMLSAPENASPGSVFALPGVTARYSEAAQGCYWRAGYAATVRFVSPSSARWRVGARGVGMRDLSVHQGCVGAATGERVRCESQITPASSPFDAPGLSSEITLDAGQTIALVVTCADDSVACSPGFFAQPIPDRGCFERDTPCAPGLACVSRYEDGAYRGRCTPGTAPSLQDVRVYDVGVMTATTRDPDGDLAEASAELFDANGDPTPHRGQLRLVSDVRHADGSVTLQWDLGRGYALPENATRARVWVRDLAGLESERVEVPIEAPTVIPVGGACVLPSFERITRTTVCTPEARCLVGPHGGRCIAQTPPTLTRAEGFFDELERALSVDLEARDPDEDITGAEIHFLDAEGRSLPGQSFEPYSSHRSVAARPDGRFRLEERAPIGTARVRVRVLDSLQLASGWIEFSPSPTSIARPGDRCDPASTARVRCQSGVAGCVPRVGEAEGRCETYETACPRYWNAARWTLPDAPGTYALDDAPRSWTLLRVSCLPPPSQSGSQYGSQYEFTAPRAGVYRFTLDTPYAVSGFALALRSACDGPALDAEHACRAADPSSPRTELSHHFNAGERVMVVTTSRSAGPRYRLSVTVP